MADDHHRRKNNTALKIRLVVLGVLVLLGVVQAATTGTVGIGALSVTFRSSAPTTTTTTTAASSGGGLDGALGTTTGETPTTSAESKVGVGSWKQSRGLLTVEVNRVENAAGRLRVHVTAINASTSKMDLPLASVTGQDDTRRDYGASLSTSKWPAGIAKNASISGYVELDQKAPAAATRFTLTFSGIIGQLAPTGGAVSVADIPIPR
ncbi:hypothetical protein FHS29_003966 [Saccharothrix tamanrassetensis]|uniref:Uncharacterized protein n=1 Tax=Saccharothrix tamanrassetensis TaxID=1051531 RepID=A0A841CIV3_9PSEU|nr:hypothetical protein [Saccharothrix tamanrassetensis]MBB5957371.1 hypothetical protein [Saccharothrix tamanrassetensis]